MSHRFAELISMSEDERRADHSRMSLVVNSDHLNPHGIVHGAVVFALADTGMGAALYPALGDGQICATIEIKINYFKPVAAGTLVCKTELLNRGRSIANLESRLYAGDTLVAQANGNYAVIRKAGAGA